jgi:hypothetical protein
VLLQVEAHLFLLDPHLNFFSLPSSLSLPFSSIAPFIHQYHYHCLSTSPLNLPPLDQPISGKYSPHRLSTSPFPRKKKKKKKKLDIVTNLLANL